MDRRALIAYVEEAGPAEHVLVARFERDDAADESAVASERRRPNAMLLPLLVRAAVAVLLVLAMVLER